MQKMEEAQRAYLAAVAAAKENPSEESLAVAAEARLRLQAFAFGHNNSNVWQWKLVSNSSRDAFFLAACVSDEW